MAQDASQGRLGVITRRMFVAALAGASAARECLVLEAVAAERMPHRLVVSGIERAPFFELREYRDAGVARILELRGIRVVLEDNGRVLIPFETLEARERAWREAGAMPGPAQKISVYRSM